MKKKSYQVNNINDETFISAGTDHYSYYYDYSCIQYMKYSCDKYKYYMKPQATRENIKIHQISPAYTFSSPRAMMIKLFTACFTSIAMECSWRLLHHANTTFCAGSRSS
mmetsp:Transcript_12713/g.21512  ORF Transcript_12713/g.21512 Transcript_12713/m.21512 type:complete len:109 (-) Transcript_12713:336-662(-)